MHVSRKVIVYWSIYGIMLSILLFIIGIIMLAAGVDMQVQAGTFLLGVVVLLGFLAYSSVRYYIFTYEFQEQEIVIEDGIILRKHIVIPYSKIQNVNTFQNIFEQMLGIGTIKLETAAELFAEGKIEGIAKPKEMAEKIKGIIQEKKSLPKEKCEEEGVLKEILKEVKYIRFMLQKYIKKEGE